MSVAVTDFTRTMQRKVAVSSVPPSALRRQGPGAPVAVHEYLASLRLGRVARTSSRTFGRWLDIHTDRLLEAVPCRHRPWGSARKALNLFLRDALYNQYLAQVYDLDEVAEWLEIPLDRAVAKGLRSAAGGYRLPHWPGLKHLDAETGLLYQEVALGLATSRGFQRVHLDMYLWLENRCGSQNAD